MFNPHCLGRMAHGSLMMQAIHSFLVWGGQIFWRYNHRPWVSWLCPFSAWQIQKPPQQPSIEPTMHWTTSWELWIWNLNSRKGPGTWPDGNLQMRLLCSMLPPYLLFRRRWRDTCPPLGHSLPCGTRSSEGQFYQWRGCYWIVGSAQSGLSNRQRAVLNWGLWYWNAPEIPIHVTHPALQNTEDWVPSLHSRLSGMSIPSLSKHCKRTTPGLPVLEDKINKTKDINIASCTACSDIKSAWNLYYVATWFIDI